MKRWLIGLVVLLVLVVPVVQLSADPTYASAARHDPHHQGRSADGAARASSRIPGIAQGSLAPPVFEPVGVVLDLEDDDATALGLAAPFVPPRV